MPLPRITALAAAALILVVPQVAAAPEAQCLTAGEFTALATYALPGAIDGTARTCSAVLPANAYLRNHGSELAARYAAGRDEVWPEAKAAFLKMSAASDADTAELFAAMPDDSLRQIADAALSGIAASKVKPGSCPTIDRMIALLAPLPAANTAELIAVLAGLGSKTGEARFGKYALCKA